MDNLNVLVEAKREYLGQLYLIMCPVMIEVFHDMYDEATKLSKGRKTLIMFQKVLKEVPNWSNQMSANHTSNIADRCAWFNDLLAAVFVACTKILSAVRLKTDNKKISLKLPTNEVFIQTCYNNVAKDLYKDPYIFHDEQSEYVRDEQLTQRMSTCIEVTVKELIPIQQILQTYMSQETRDIDLDGEVHDTEDPDVFDDPEEMPEAMPEAESLPENEPMMGGEDQVQPTGLENEFKTVPGVQAPEPVMEPEMGMEPGLMSEVSAPPQATEEEDDGVLFGDAPDQRVKKTAYN
jgi:primosomal protein N''|tara:strand:- start:130 stop:1005 length:876 start_codon:yes stop_codon:yes gene_type:complete